MIFIGIGSKIKFYISFWASVMKAFWNYLLSFTVVGTSFFFWDALVLFS